MIFIRPYLLAMTIVFLSLQTACSRSNITLRISTPKNGTVFAPGDTITVDVSVDQDIQLTYITLFTEIITLPKPPNLTNPEKKKTYSFALIVPDIIGPKKISAFAMGPNKERVFSDPVTINIEKSLRFRSIEAQLNRFSFDFSGDSLPLNAYGISTDGARQSITESSKLIVTSENPQVAIVDNQLNIIATGAGETHII